MTLKELCSQFTVDANIVIQDVTSGETVTDFVRDNKKFCENILVEKIEIKDDEIHIFCALVDISKEREIYEAAQMLRSYCQTKPTLDDCAKCIFYNSNFGKENIPRKSCLIGGIPQYWDF